MTTTIRATTPPHRCNACQNRWGGIATYHCRACHQTFTSITSFDKHQRAGRCEHPAAAGLTASTRAGYTAWGRQADNANADWWAA